VTVGYKLGGANGDSPVGELELYARAGVAEYWLVDPQARQIDLLVAVDGRYGLELARDGM
jgi:hypothetical protein